MQCTKQISVIHISPWNTHTQQQRGALSLSLSHSMNVNITFM